MQSPDDDGTLSAGLDGGKVAQTLRDALGNQDIILPQGDAVLHVEVITPGSHWRVTEMTPATYYRLRIHRQTRQVKTYSGLRARRLADGWLNRDDLSSAPDEVQQVPCYSVPIGPDDTRCQRQ